ncbi:MAG: glycosyltransferase family 1 protein [Oryzomonas sp.]|uniref:glycosyltransferase family 4 protein n=1 Tax=Oryzomonas sp. TaxID=2855186 RepID=UPI0028401480|nr:glycosyltransferase family 1 protein [Oryzomonas sp.]MDR3580397.1 glycosyltransferase family 1 protein [Oryzomonas sp.]
MHNNEDAPRFKLCMMCYPYYPSKNTGRGHDRYISELTQNIEKIHAGIKLRLLQQGCSKGVLTAGIKHFKFIYDLLTTKADVYHAISPIGGATAAILGKSPLIITIHDLVPFNLKGYDYSWKYWYVRLCIKISVKRSSAIVVPYKVTKDEIVTRFGIPESKIYVVNYGVDHALYHPRTSVKRENRKILYIGEVSRSKGVDSLIRAFGIVKQFMAEAELVIAGKRSRDQPFLEEMVNEMGLNNVTFEGYIPENELSGYYSTATVMIFPSRCGFGLSTLEAMACGTPVIVGAVLDAPEFLSDAGILVNPNDIDQIAKSILKVLTEPELRGQLSAKAIERAGEFSWEKMSEKTVEVYRDVLEKIQKK